MTPQKYNQINELLSEYSTIFAGLEGAEAEIKRVQLAAAAGLLPTHAELKVKLTDLEAKLKTLADEHYAELKVKLTDLEAKLKTLADEHYAELFPVAEEKRTHNTPFGALQYRKSSSLEYKDGEKVLLKMRLACNAEYQRARHTDTPVRFTWDQIVRTKEEPNLDALSEFDDATLSLFGITREHKDNFKVSPFDMKSDKPSKKDGKK